MSEVQIDIGTEADLEPFVELLESAAQWLWVKGIRQWRPGSMRAQRTPLERWTRSGHLVVARSEADLVGGCALVPEPTAEWAFHSEPSHYVHKLVVARSHAGQGIGRLVLRWCQGQAQDAGMSRLRLDCWDGNAKLRAFYRECGFSELEAVHFDGYSVRLFELQFTPDLSHAAEG